MRSTQKPRGSGDGKDKGSRTSGGGTSRKRKNTQDDVDVDDGNDDEEGMWQTVRRLLHFAEQSRFMRKCISVTSCRRFPVAA